MYLNGQQKDSLEQNRKEYLEAGHAAAFDAINLQETQGQTIDPDNPQWGIVGAFGLWVFSVLALFLTSIVAIVGFVALSGVEFDQQNIMENPTAIAVSLLSTLPAHLITLAAAWLLITRAGKHPFWQSLGWTWRGGFGMRNCILITLALLTLHVVMHLFIEHSENELEKMIKSSRAAVFIVAGFAVLTAPLVEEVLYRGVLFPAFKRKYGTAAAVVIVTVLFSIIHVPQYFPSYGVIASLGLLSLTLTLVRARTGSLLPCFFIHTLFNGIQAFLMIIEPYLPKQ